MPTLKPLSFLLAGATALALPIGNSFSLSAEAQERSAPLVQFPMLDNANCQYITSGVDYDFSSYGTRGVGWPFARVDASPIINRQVYNSDSQLRATRGSYTALACDIDTEDFETLSLQLGVMDASADRNEKIHAKIYQSGTVVSNRPDIAAGEVIDFVVDLQSAQYARPGNISIELTCESSSQNYGCILYFLQAELSPTGNFISRARLPSEWSQEGNSTTSALF